MFVKSSFQPSGLGILTKITIAACSILLPSVSLALPTNTIDLSGNKISYLGRIYDSSKDTSTFRYRVSRGLLNKPLESLQIKMPNSATAAALVDVQTSASNLLSLDSLTGIPSVLLTKLPFPLLTSDVDLVLRGNVPEGSTNLTLQSTTDTTPVTKEFLGPVVVCAELDLGGQGVAGCPTATTTPTPPTGTAKPDSTPTAIPTQTGATPTPKSNLSCIINSKSTLSAVVGDPVNFDIQVLGSTSSPLEVDYTDWPSGAVLSVPSGGNVSPGTTLTGSWTPLAVNVGKNVLPITLRVGPLSQLVCDVEIEVTKDSAPVINVVGLANPVACQGLVTLIPLDASASYDPEGRPLSYSWSHGCSNGTLTKSNTAQTALKLTIPGTGSAQACSVSLTVSDGVKSASTIIPIDVAACNINCDASQMDSCGVCGGTNRCLDCNGIPYGDASLDRCGVCGGKNSCLDCKGTVNGGSKYDLCGICGGDDTSCRTCSPILLQSVLAKFDSTALSQAQTIGHALREVKKNPKAEKIAGALRAQANQIYTASWSLVWSLNQQDLICSHYAGCSEVSSGDKLTEYKTNTEKLKAIATRSASLLKKFGGKVGQRRAKKLRKLIQGSLFDADTLTKLYPATTHKCE